MRRPWLATIALGLSSTLFRLAAGSGAAPRAGKPIIIDTDILSDVDDVGALAVANILHSCHVADLQGVAINTHSKYGALAASAVNTYFGNGDIPIAAIRPLTDETFLDRWNYTLGEYASKIAHNWPRALASASDTRAPLPLYRALLAAAPNHTLTLISLGFPTNLAALLASGPDAHSPLPGRALVSAKVAELVLMGGRYPGGREFNLEGDAPAARAVVNDWPRDVPVTFVGFELGKRVLSGAGLPRRAPRDSPVLAAYQWYVGRCRTARESWDPLAVLYGVLGRAGGVLPGWQGGVGRGDMFAFGNRGGYNRVLEDGSNEWVDDAGVTNQHWLTLAEGWSNETVAEVLDGLYSHGPESKACGGVDRDEL